MHFVKVNFIVVSCVFSMTFYKRNSIVSFHTHSVCAVMWLSLVVDSVISDQISVVCAWISPAVMVKMCYDWPDMNCLWSYEWVVQVWLDTSAIYEIQWLVWLWIKTQLCIQVQSGHLNLTDQTWVKMHFLPLKKYGMFTSRLRNM